jgi:uncharacterized RDD family membrane protein YckC
LPAAGPHSVARVGRRVLALIIDWAIAVAITCVVFGYTLLDYDGFRVLMIFVGLQIVLTITMGGSIGYRLLGLRLITITGGWVGFWRPIVRALLLGIVLPALVWDSDQRGFHDKIAGTVLIRR